MINPKLILIFLVGCLALAWACKPAASPDKAAAEISEALDGNNFDAARKKADDFFASGVKLDTVGIPRLCMLAVTLTRLGESAEHGHDYAAHALQCYRVAMRKDSVASMEFYTNLEGEDFKFANLLLQLAGRVDARDSGILVEDEAEESSTMLPEHE